MSGIKNVLNTLEGEAVESGASTFVFRLHAIKHKSFKSEALWKRMGYDFMDEGDNVITVTKQLSE